MVFESLFDFQKKAVHAAKDALFNRNLTSVIEALPTGAGKTIIFNALIRELIENTHERALVLVHRDKLMKQTYEKLRYVWPDASYGLVKGPIRDFSKQITIASVQTLTNHLDKLDESINKLGPFKICVIDEAHHTLASAWMKIHSHLVDCGTKILGVTATPIRTKEDEDLTSIFQELTFNISIFELIKKGYLSEFKAFEVPTGMYLNEIEIDKRIGDYTVKQLRQVIDFDELDRDIVRSYKDKLTGRKTICFGVDIKHIEALASCLNNAGCCKAVAVHGEMHPKEQDRILNEFSAGVFDTIVSCDLLTEGYDEPSVDAIIMGRPTTSKILYVQMLGRGLRTYPGKEDCIVIDMVMNHNNNLITIQDLLGFYGLNNAEAIYKGNQPMNAERGRARESFNARKDNIDYLTAINNLTDEKIGFEEVKLLEVNMFPCTTMQGSQYFTARRNLSIAVYLEDNKYTTYLIFNAANDRCIAPLCNPVDKSFALTIAQIYLFDYGSRQFVDSAALWRAGRPTEEQRKNLELSIGRHKQWYHQAPIDITSVKTTKGAYSDAITAVYSSMAIKNPKIKRITRDEATAKLREMILAETLTDKANEERSDKIKNLTLTIGGDYTVKDQQMLLEMIGKMTNNRQNNYAVQFMTENQVIIDENTVSFVSPKPLTEGQYRFLYDRIKSVFRLYFRTKTFRVVAPEIIKKSMSA